MEGSKIHILEELPKAGGSLDGENMPLKAMLSGWSWNGEPLWMFVGLIQIYPFIRNR